MANSVRSFTGKMNLDVDAYRIDPSDYLDGLNITRDAQGQAQDKVVSNIVGNQKVLYTLPSGTNKGIGKFEDKVRSRVYYFVYNSNGNHAILYYNRLTSAIVKVFISKTDSGGVDILGFTASGRITSTNIIYRDTIGDLLFFLDSLGRPSKINVLKFQNGSYASITRSIIDVQKATPQMPIKAVYEYDADINQNNLKGQLFKFKYRFVLDTNEKTVWSSASQVPLPYQSSDQSITTDKRYNARINLYFSTGDETVTGIEIAVSTNLAASASDYKLVTLLNKSDLSIGNNVVSNFLFYNDSVYPPVDIKEVALRQDYVPTYANAQELLNGNTPIYGGITEGYDLLKGIFTSTVGIDNVVDNVSGMLFFASQDSFDSYGTSTSILIRLRGTGSNTSGVPTTILNANGATFYVQAVLSNGTDVSFSYVSATTSIATILSGLLTAAIAKGFTGSVSGTTLTITQAAVILKTSYYSQTLANVTSYQNNVFYSLLMQCNYSYGILYEDFWGNTNSVITTANLNITTPALDDTDLTKYPYLTFTIANRPPIWAKNYRIVRTPNLSYDKRLFWVSDKAFSNVTATSIPPNQLAYIGRSNMVSYNADINSTDGYVSYQYQPGDRIRFLARYTTTGAVVQLGTNLDFEIVGTETSYNLNGVINEGQFIKIKYPTNQISADFKFDGTDNFQNYKIFIYNPRKSQSTATNVFYEIGLQFPIGNPYTTNAYHIGNRITQTSDLVTAASNTLYLGDEFLRYRNVPTGFTYGYQANDLLGFDSYTALQIEVPTTISTTNYDITTQSRRSVDNAAGGYPINTDTGYLFKNNSTSPSGTINVRLKGALQIYNKTDATSSFSLWYIITANQAPFANKTSAKILVNLPVKLNITTEYDFDIILPIPPTGRLWLATNPEADISFNALTILPFQLTVITLQNQTIEIIEPSFSDISTIDLNSNDNLRPAVVEVNAKNNYYPTTVRFGGAYQDNTSINNTNRFYPDDLDDYDRSFGDIKRFHVRDRSLKVYQRFKIGNVPVLTQIVQDTTGNPLSAESNKLINKIQYYQGDFGIGDSPASLCWNNFADYGVDDYRGVVWRLSQDGIVPISLLYGTNAFFVDKLRYFRTDLNNGIAAAGTVYPGNPSVVGVFDAYTNKYIIALEVINRYSDPNTLIFHQDAYTISFNEANNSFESFYSYKPELMACLNTLLVSIKDGAFWTHDSSTYCNFYGTQYPCSITLCFNDVIRAKKTFISLMETGTFKWNCPSITTSMNSYGTTKQQSVLIDADITVLEGTYNASFLRDSNSINGLINGSTLKGEYIIIKFQVDAANAAYMVSLNTVQVKYIESPQNAR